MTLHDFSTSVHLTQKSDIHKCLYIAYYLKTFRNIQEFTVLDILNAYEELTFFKPNLHAFRKQIAGSTSFVRGNSENTYKLKSKLLQSIEQEIGKTEKDPV